MSTDIEDEIKDDLQENQENTLNNYTEEELEDMKEKFRLFDDDGGGGLTAKELERRKKGFWSISIIINWDYIYTFICKVIKMLENLFSITVYGA